MCVFVVLIPIYCDFVFLLVAETNMQNSSWKIFIILHSFCVGAPGQRPATTAAMNGQMNGKANRPRKEARAWGQLFPVGSCFSSHFVCCWFNGYLYGELELDFF